jgi:lysophospholipase L1-like esterase
LIASLSLALAVAIRTSIRDRQGHALASARSRIADGVLRVAILGDSVAHGAGDEQRLGIAGNLENELAGEAEPVSVVNLGLNGARTFNVEALLSRPSTRAVVRNADVVVLSIGGNDLYGDSVSRLLSGVLPSLQRQRVLAGLGGLVGRIERQNPAARIYVLGLYDPYRRSSLRNWLDRQVNLWDAAVIARFADSRNLVVVRICDLLDRDDRLSAIDHFHPGGRGYLAIAKRIASSL